jgi:N6-adenosine-specific RNA methylase IME4
MKYQVCRPLTPIEYEALKADIAEHGVLIPIEVDENGDILDGHHRVQAWQELRAEGVNVPQWAKLIRQGLSEEQKRNHARKLNVLRRQMDEEERKRIWADMKLDGMSYPAIVAATGVPYGTVYNGINEVIKSDNLTLPPTNGIDGKTYHAQQQPKPEPPPTLFDPGDSVDLDPVAAEETVKEIRQGRREELREQRVDKINDIAKGNEALGTDKRYPVIYADPPWCYEHSKTVSREIENQYPTMPLAEICALDVSEIATPDGVLFLWATSPKLAEAIQVLEAWGFVYRTCLVWDKERIGMGYYARQQHELLLIGTRGELPVPEPANRPASVIRIARDNEHSTKPDHFHALIERMYPEYDRIELFARHQREGWAAWGNESNGH